MRVFVNTRDMGVKLQNLIDRTPINVKQLQGRVIAIDAPNIIFSLFSFTLREEQQFNSAYITDRTGRVISHLYGLLYRLHFFYTHKIFPIFCFDGKESELKRIVSKDMLHDFQKLKKLHKEALQYKNFDAAKTIALSNAFLWPNIMEESRHLLGLLGVPYVNAPASAEAQCAHLVKQRIAHYANSQDFDILLYGCPYTVQNLFKSLKRKVKEKWAYTKIQPLFIHLQNNLKRLEIDQFQLVDLAILLGTDYFPSGIQKIGPMTSLKLIKKYTSIENILTNESKKYNFSRLTSELIHEIRKIFLLPDVLESNYELQWHPPKKADIITFLCEDHNLNKERVQMTLEKISKSYGDCKNFFNRPHPLYGIQSTLDWVLK